MTDHIRSLRLLHSRTPAGDERDALEAAIKRMGLPVIETCGTCPGFIGGARIWEGPDKPLRLTAATCEAYPLPAQTVTRDAEPPDDCPIRPKK